MKTEKVATHYLYIITKIFEIKANRWIAYFDLFYGY